MGQKQEIDSGNGAANRSRFITVIFGIALFAAGFAVVASAASDAPDAESESTSWGVVSPDLDDSGARMGVIVLVGICMSVVGLLLATIVPALRFFMERAAD